MSCDLEGQDVNTEQHLSERISSDPVFGLVVIGNTAIFSTWFSATVQSTLVATRIPFWKEETTLRGSRELFSLVATAPSMQPPSKFKIIFSKFVQMFLLIYHGTSCLQIYPQTLSNK